MLATFRAIWRRGLSSITGGRGSYAMELSRYEPVPGNVQQRVIDQAKRDREAAKEGH
jgi:translation elongation factor EF-G